jgi:hypothetical protein
MTEPRSTVQAATSAALWALSNGTCYAPGCSFPVVFEVRPDVYRKNAQVAHIHGVKPGAPRYKQMPARERESFSNLLLLCMPHHGEVDDRIRGETLYPPELLRKWKSEREGSGGAALANVQVPNEDVLFEALTQIFEPPLKRLERIADRLESTGTINAESVAELQQVVNLLKTEHAGPDAQTARALAFAAETLSAMNIGRSAAQLAQAAEMLAAQQRNPRFG